jgi:hypothetical protein
MSSWVLTRNYMPGKDVVLCGKRRANFDNYINDMQEKDTVLSCSLTVIHIKLVGKM